MVSSLGAKAGINLPLQAAEHYYLITEKIEGLPRDLPVLEDPATYTYYREVVGGLMWITRITRSRLGSALL